jgi:leucine dehydrogenase
MAVFEELERDGHEEVVFGYDRDAGLKAIIAIHNTSLGPALGGTRMWPYESESDALKDVLRLSRGMTYKAALAGLNLGGGKAVIFGDPEKDKNEILFRAFGRMVEGLHGRYITAEDVGTTPCDMEWVRAETKYVTGIDEAHGGSGDPSPVTARGVYSGIRACVEEVLGKNSLQGVSLAIQGAGHVGLNLAEILQRDGAVVYISDINSDKVKTAVEKYGAIEVAPENIYSLDVDIFAPCALGAVVNDKTIEMFRCRIIAGAANNQLDDELRHGRMLMEKNILYAPDYAINSGGLINVENELEGYIRERACAQAEGIYDIIKSIIRLSREEGIPTNAASNRIAEMRIKRVGRLRRKFVSIPPHIFRGGRIFK